MTWQEKREERFKRWLSPANVKFKSKEAEKKYKARVTRFIKAIKMEEPDRVPCMLPVGYFPAAYIGVNFHTIMYDYSELRRAWLTFIRDFPDMDTFHGPGLVMPGRILDALDNKMQKWPGHGLPEDAWYTQFVEGEYMKADEYDALIKNPSDFWMRVYMPRIFGAFESWKMLLPWTNIIELPSMHFGPFMMPQVQASMQTLIDIGNELARYMKVIGEFGPKTLEAGYPGMRGTFAKAPFDVIGDTLRGTQGIFFDVFRQPDKLLEGIEVITTLMIDSVIASVNASRGQMAMFPLHKGADGWMSEKQFDTFYWPSLKKVINALIDEGILVTLFAEGSYDTRLESVNEFPKGAVHWLFDKTDMARAKKVLGDRCCISGNVPTSLMITGTPKQVKEYCRNLIEVCGKGGGYILAGGAQVDNGKPENFRAMLEAARDYGVYNK